MSAWFYLITAGLLEIGWPLGLNLAQKSGWRVPGIIIAVLLLLPVPGAENHSDGHSLRRMDRHWGGRGVFGWHRVSG